MIGKAVDKTSNTQDDGKMCEWKTKQMDDRQVDETRVELVNEMNMDVCKDMMMKRMTCYGRQEVEKNSIERDKSLITTKTSKGKV